MNRIVLYVFLVFILIGVAAFEYKQTPQMKPPKISSDAVFTTAEPVFVNYQARFLIFTNNIKRDFSAEMYHNLSEDAFITKVDPTRVYVKKRDIPWRSFFDTLPFSITSECLTTGLGERFCSGKNGTLRFFLNGVEDTHLLEKPIQNGDKVVITFGQETEEQIKKQLQQL